MRSKLLTAVAVTMIVLLASVTTATAAAVINGKDIKKGSIPFTAINKKAVKKLQSTGPRGPAGPSAVKYWAAVDENGSIVKQSGGLSSSRVTNGGATQKTRVTFPADVTNCFWIATNGDVVNVLGANDVVLPTHVTVGRSSLGGNTLEVAVTNAGGTTLIWDAFYVGAVC